MTIGERIRACRKERKMSQEELAKACGVTKNAISKIERGDTSQPKPVTLYPLAAALGVRAEWLITGKGEKYDLDDIQRRIRDEMRARHMTVLDLVEAMGGRIAPETIEDIVRGWHKVTDKEMQILADAFKKSVVWLRYGIEKAIEETPRIVYDVRGEPVPTNLSQDEIDLIRDFRVLDEKDRAAVLTLAHALAEKVRAETKKSAGCAS